MERCKAYHYNVKISMKDGVPSCSANEGWPCPDAGKSKNCLLIKTENDNKSGSIIISNLGGASYANNNSTLSP